MNLRLVLIVLAGAAAALLLGLAGAPAPVTPPSGPTRTPARPPVRERLPAAPSSAPNAPLPTRNPFEYAGAPHPLATRVAPPRTSPSPLPASPASTAPVKLVGFVHRAGAVRAVIAIRGEVVILGAGDAADGYTALAVDEDAGVRLRDPEGAELTLAVGAGG